VTPLLQAVESCYDAIPRVAPDRVRVEEFGSLRLFVRVGPGFPLYARPAAPRVEVSTQEVVAAADRMRELDVPVAFEWVHDLVPGLVEAVRAAGLTVDLCPLLVLDRAALPVGPPDGIAVRVVQPDDVEGLRALETVTASAFGFADGSVGSPGPERLDALARAIRAGHAARVLGWRNDEPSGPGRPTVLAAGGLQLAAGLAEVVGVGTLPAARGRGLGGAVTAALARHALDRGAEEVFLSAGDAAASRVYQRVGFRRVGTAALAAPPPA